MGKYIRELESKTTSTGQTLMSLSEETTNELFKVTVNFFTVRLETAVFNNIGFLSSAGTASNGSSPTEILLSRPVADGANIQAGSILKLEGREFLVVSKYNDSKIYIDDPGITLDPQYQSFEYKAAYIAGVDSSGDIKFYINDSWLKACDVTIDALSKGGYVTIPGERVIIEGGPSYEPSLYLASGRVHVVDGGIDIKDGEINVDRGSVNLTKGSINTDEGAISTRKGDITTLDGDFITSSGSFSTVQGNISTNQGNIFTNQGNIAAVDGYVQAKTPNPSSPDFSSANDSVSIAATLSGEQTKYHSTGVWENPKTPFLWAQPLSPQYGFKDKIEITFDQVFQDTQGEWDGTRYTAGVAGFYQAIVQVLWTSGTWTVDATEIDLFLESSEPPGVLYRSHMYVPQAAPWPQALTGIIPLSVGASFSVTGWAHGFNDITFVTHSTFINLIKLDN